MPRLRIADLLATSPVDPTAHLDCARVQELAASREPPSPVVVFDTETGLLLVDGYHRIAAAQLRGQDTIDAEVHHGSRCDALEYAAAVGAAERGVSPEEALRRIELRSEATVGVYAASRGEPDGWSLRGCETNTGRSEWRTTRSDTLPSNAR